MKSMNLIRTTVRKHALALAAALSALAAGGSVLAQDGPELSAICLDDIHQRIELTAGGFDSPPTAADVVFYDNEDELDWVGARRARGFDDDTYTFVLRHRAGHQGRVDVLLKNGLTGPDGGLFYQFEFRRGRDCGSSGAILRTRRIPR